MIHETRLTPPQFNHYKYTELSNSMKQILHDQPPHRQFETQEIIREYCWTRHPLELVSKWQHAFKEPTNTMSNLSLLHFNIRHFYSNQADLADMVNANCPSIISINELGTVVPDNTIKRLLFSHNIFTNKGSNTHGGVVLGIDKKLTSHPIKVDQPNIVTTRVTVGSNQILVASIYSPPTEPIPFKVMNTFHEMSKNIIITGEMNAKHSDWGCSQVNTKCRLLAHWLNEHNRNVVNSGMITSTRSSTTIDLVISDEVSEAATSQVLGYNYSDHRPILTVFPGVVASGKTQIISRTDLELFTTILSILQEQFQLELANVIHDVDETFNWFQSLEQFMSALKLRVTTFWEAKRRRPSIPQALRILLQHKHYLQNIYRHTRLEDDRLRLRSWNSMVRHEFRSHGQRGWETIFTSVASLNPKKF